MSEVGSVISVLNLIPRLGLSQGDKRTVLRVLQSCCAHWTAQVQTDSQRLQELTNQQLQAREYLKVSISLFVEKFLLFLRLVVKNCTQSTELAALLALVSTFPMKYVLLIAASPIYLPNSRYVLSWKVTYRQ